MKTKKATAYSFTFPYSNEAFDFYNDITFHIWKSEIISLNVTPEKGGSTEFVVNFFTYDTKKVATLAQSYGFSPVQFDTN